MSEYHHPPSVILLLYESPWPPYSGGAMRSLGLLEQIGKTFEMEIVILVKRPLAQDQKNVLGKFSNKITQVPLKNLSIADKLRVMVLMFKLCIPYHCAIIKSSFKNHPEVLEKIHKFHGIVYASYGHWSGLINGKNMNNWIVDQHNADIQFWKVYASQTSNLLVKLLALINYRLADKFFRRIYKYIGRIISVCEEDKQLTLSVAPNAKIDVIPNGIDCAYYLPEKIDLAGQPRLLFTGTSAMRNVTALREFVRDIFPLIKKRLPDVELVVGGNFNKKTQARFSSYNGIRFTGPVEDLRATFNQCHVYISPFDQTHGSKLKIAEAMAMAMPIVSTPQGVRGFKLVDGESVFIAHSNEQFANHVLSLLADPELREKTGAEARKIATSYLDWRILGERLSEIINSQ